MTDDRSPIESQLQKAYYAATADRYNDLHVHEKDEHFFALATLTGMLDYLEAHSVLDIGSGTGRMPLYIKSRRPDIRVVGIEPVGALRQVGYRNGLSESELLHGDATALVYADKAFDVVTEFGVLHHIRRPERAVAEMLRVARAAIFISDANNFGQGSLLARTIKQSINALGLWPVANFIRTGGKGYTISEGDGLAYSYSVFSNYRQIRRACRQVHIINTLGGGRNAYRSAPHVALLGIK